MLHFVFNEALEMKVEFVIMTVVNLLLEFSVLQVEPVRLRTAISLLFARKLVPLIHDYALKAAQVGVQMGIYPQYSYHSTLMEDDIRCLIVWPALTDGELELLLTLFLNNLVFLYRCGMCIVEISVCQHPSTKMHQMLFGTPVPSALTNMPHRLINILKTFAYPLKLVNKSTANVFMIEPYSLEKYMKIKQSQLCKNSSTAEGKVIFSDHVIHSSSLLDKSTPVPEVKSVKVPEVERVKVPEVESLPSSSFLSMSQALFTISAANTLGNVYFSTEQSFNSTSSLAHIDTVTSKAIACRNQSNTCNSNETVSSDSLPSRLRSELGFAGNINEPTNLDVCNNLNSIHKLDNADTQTLIIKWQELILEIINLDSKQCKHGAIRRHLGLEHGQKYFDNINDKNELNNTSIKHSDLNEAYDSNLSKHSHHGQQNKYDSFRPKKVVPSKPLAYQDTKKQDKYSLFRPEKVVPNKLLIHHDNDKQDKYSPFTPEKEVPNKSATPHAISKQYENVSSSKYSSSKQSSSKHSSSKHSSSKRERFRNNSVENKSSKHSNKQENLRSKSHQNQRDTIGKRYHLEWSHSVPNKRNSSDLETNSSQYRKRKLSSIDDLKQCKLLKCVKEQPDDRYKLQQSSMFSNVEKIGMTQPFAYSCESVDKARKINKVTLANVAVSNKITVADAVVCDEMTATDMADVIEVGDDVFITDKYTTQVCSKFTL